MARMLVPALMATLASLALAGAAEAAAAKNYLLVDLTRTPDRTAYLARFAVGNPPQYQSLKVDTGSPTYSFLSPRNSQCTESDHPCIFGTYDNLTSTTAQYEGEGFYDGLIDHGAGSLINDTVTIGGKTLHGYFGYITEYEGQPEDVAKPTTTILGLAQQCPEAVGPNCTVGYTSWVQQLYNASLIDRRAYSVYLGPDHFNQSTYTPQLLLGGYVDVAKQASKPFTVPMVDPSNLMLALGQTNTVNVTGMNILYPNGTQNATSFGAKGQGLSALVDTGNPYWALPEPVLDNVLAWFGPSAQYQLYQGYYSVDCSLASKTPSPTLQVQFPGSKTNVINVPFNRLITRLNSTSCASFIENGGPVEDGLSALADPFIRSAYATFDVSTLSVTFSQVKYTNASNIQPFGRL